MSITPIETFYKGNRFRSRLEARWAVFFDTAGIPYRYEEEGYDVGGTWYLPDFWLPEQGCWIEIKGRPPTEKELGIMRDLVEGSFGRGYFIAGDIPYPYPTEGWIVGYDCLSEMDPSSWVQCPVCLKIDIAEGVNGAPGSSRNAGTNGCPGCIHLLYESLGKIMLGEDYWATATHKVASNADDFGVWYEPVNEAAERILKTDVLHTTSETPLLREAYHAARKVRFDATDPPLTPEEKAIRVRTEWDRILDDLRKRGLKNSDYAAAAKVFDWMQVRGVTGNTLDLTLSVELKNPEDKLLLKGYAENEPLLNPFLESIRECCGLSMSGVSVDLS